MSDVDLKRGLDEAKEEATSPSAKKAKTEDAPPSVKDGKKAENGDHKESAKEEVRSHSTTKSCILAPGCRVRYFAMQSIHSKFLILSAQICPIFKL